MKRELGIIHSHEIMHVTINVKKKEKKEYARKNVAAQGTFLQPYY